MLKLKLASRNSIKFNTDDIIDYTILNKPLQYLLQSLQSFLKLHNHVNNINNINNVDNILNLFIVKWNIKCNDVNWLCIVDITFSNKKWQLKTNNRNSIKSSMSSKYTIEDDDALIKLKLEACEYTIIKMIDIFNYNFKSSYGINCCYLEINKKVIHNGLFIDVIKINELDNNDELDNNELDISISYNPKSFIQPDDTIRYGFIHYLLLERKDILQENIKLFLIGGECVLFGKLFNKNHKTFYTDFESIYNDCKYNHPEYQTHLINYNTCNIAFGINSIIIANTGYQGLGINLSNNILLSQCHYIYIISCNENSFQKDFKILSGNYKIDSVLEIKTNYSVWIYKLKI